ncbi:MAG TPA: hypothetical protein VL614_07825 [Acetobacteraceae bacterium]|jgi:hypothetical protein|nr:hypothetical protein [Acetobacteraceae bacterium]
MRLRGTRGASEGSGDLLRNVVLGALIAAILASSVAVVSAARTLDLAPVVGDILVFKQGARMPTDWAFTANNNNAVACTLDPSVMARAGGSLVVEERLDDARAYRIHWAGGATSNGVTNCGGDVDLVLERADLQLLSNAVGGPGVEHRTFAYF